MDHTRDLTTEEKILFGVRHGMVPMEWDDSEVVRMCEAAVMKLSVAPIVGWTKGLHWVVYGSCANIRIYQGTKRFSAYLQALPDGSLKGSIWVDPNFFPTIALFAEEIRADVFAQIGRLRAAVKDITDFQLALQGLQAETYPKWAAAQTREAREDTLHQMLDEKYKNEFLAAEAKYISTMRDIFLKHARARGARYISIGQSMFGVLEDVRTDGAQSLPVAHQIMSDLNLSAGSYSSYAVKAMNLFSILGKDMEGIWFVDTDEPVKVYDIPLNQTRMDERMIMMGQGKLDMDDWLKSCGAVVRSGYF